MIKFFYSLFIITLFVSKVCAGPIVKINGRKFIFKKSKNLKIQNGDKLKIFNRKGVLMSSGIIRKVGKTKVLGIASNIQISLGMKVKIVRKIRRMPSAIRSSKSNLPKKRKTREWSVGIAYSRDNLRASNDNLSGNGLGIHFAKEFKLSKEMSTKSKLEIKVIDYGNRNQVNNFSLFGRSISGSIEARQKEIGVSQSLGFDIYSTHDFEITPYLSLGFSYGELELEGNSKFHEHNYFKYGASVGVSANLNGRYSPFLQYSLERLNEDQEDSTSPSNSAVSLGMSLKF